jgi:subtilisin family serine protease
MMAMIENQRAIIYSTYVQRALLLICALVGMIVSGCQQNPVYLKLQVVFDASEGAVKIAPDSSNIKKNDSVVLTAIPNSGYVFESWSGDINSSQNPLTFTITQDLTIEAHFAVDPQSAIAYALEGSWASFDKSDHFANTGTVSKAVGRKDISNFRTVHYYDMNQAPVRRDRAILVKLRDGENPSLSRELNSFGENDKKLNSSAPFQRIIIDQKKSAEIDSIVDYYRSLPDVEWAEEDHLSKTLLVPDDAFYSYQWNLSRIGMPAAWDYTLGESSVIVAVLDTGVYFQLDDFAQTKFVRGYDFVHDTTTPLDDNGHGTHVIGSIAESTNNEIGVAGMAPNISIMPVKVLASDGYGLDSDIAAGIYFATNNGASIINLSFGGEYSIAIDASIKYATDQGVLIIAAAGNEAAPTLNYPAALPGVMSVGATNDANVKAPYSNYGMGLDIVAPGGDLNRTLHNQEYGDDYPAGILQQTRYDGEIGYWYLEGTSMAAPHVTGLAALLKSKNPSLSVADIVSIIEESATDLGLAGYDTTYGWGLIDAAKALGIPGYIIHDIITSAILPKSGALEKWRIQVAPGTIDATLEYSKEKGNLNLHLLNAEGAQVAESTPENSTTHLAYTVPATFQGTYYLEISFRQ